MSDDDANLTRQQFGKHWKLLSAFVVLYVAAVAGYVVWAEAMARRELMANVDERLLLAAKSLKYMLAPDFHDRAVDETSIGREEVDRNRETISAFAAESGFQWLYTLVEKDGRFHFSAPTVSAEELQERDSWYFYPYDEISPEFVAAHRNRITTYAEYTDRWGSFRSVALPQISPGGVPYLACADYKIGFIDELARRHLWRGLFTAFLFLLFGLSLILFFRHVFQVHSQEMNQINRELLRHKHHLEEVVAERTARTLAANQNLRREIEEREKIEHERLIHLKYLENMERVECVMHDATSLDLMMERVLAEVRNILDCDRAWFLCPCDPMSDTWRVPMESTHPDHPGAGSLGRDIAMTPEVASGLAIALATDGPVCFGPGMEHPLSTIMNTRFGVHSQMVIALYPKLGPPWLFGVHQCGRPREWNAEERRFFREAGRRFTDGLSSLLFLRDLMKSEERYRELVENITETLFSLDEAGAFLYVSPSIERTLGFSPTELRSQPFHRFVLEEDRPMLEGILEELRNGEARVFEMRVSDREGKVRWLHVSARPTREGDVIRGVSGLLSDITRRRESEEEKRRLEEHLARSRKMEALGLLAGGVAHDLNNILSGIVSYPDLLLMEMPPDHPLRRPVETMRESGQRSAAIVDDLLSLSRRSLTSMDVVDLNAVIHDYLDSPEHERLRERFPTVVFEFRPSPDLFLIKGSSVHLRKVVTNLVYNAAEAQPGGGFVSLSTTSRYVDVVLTGQDLVPEGDYSLFTVRDQGMGIAPEDLPHIFEPFYTKKIMGLSGTGLGMSVVWGTVRDHEGRITVSSEKGKGTRFDLYFPATRESRQAERPPVPLERYLGNGQTILVVDDVEQQREITTAMLNRLGYETVSVNGGEAAVEWLRNERADLVILDMIMPPGMDGLDTYRRVIEFRAQQAVLLVSGFSESERVREARALGAGGYLRKPFTLERLGMTVRDVLEGEGGRAS